MPAFCLLRRVLIRPLGESSGSRALTVALPCGGRECRCAASWRGLPSGKRQASRADVTQRHVVDFSVTRRLLKNMAEL
jgi:hypothetical protein